MVQVLGQALEGEDFSARPAGEQWGAAVELFRRRRVLLVWDNFESTLPAFQESEDGDSPVTFGSEERQRLATLFRELTEGEPAGRLLVTCRPEETGLPGVKEITLHGLARPDSLHLLAAVLDRKSISTDRRGYDRRAIDAFLQALDDPPLSIALVAPHLKELTPAEIHDELREHLERFADAGAEEARNRSLRASLEFSKKRLSEAAQRVLRPHRRQPSPACRGHLYTDDGAFRLPPPACRGFGVQGAQTPQGTLCRPGGLRSCWSRGSWLRCRYPACRCPPPLAAVARGEGVGGRSPPHRRQLDQTRANVQGFLEPAPAQHLVQVVGLEPLGDQLAPAQHRRRIAMGESWSQELEAKGWAEGRAKGRADGTRDAIVLLWEKRFGPIPDAVRNRLEAITDLERLHEILEQLLAVRSADDLDL